MTFYVLNFCCMGFANYLMWRRIGNEKNKLAEPPIDPLILKLAYARSLVVPFLFFIDAPGRLLHQCAICGVYSNVDTCRYPYP